MSEGELFGVVLFHSVSSAFKLESILRTKNVPTKLVPTPRHLDSDCGTSLRFSWEDYEKVKEEVDRSDIEIKDIRKL